MLKSRTVKDEMNGRERVTAAIKFTGPDRIPHQHCFLPATLKQYPELIKLLREYPSDFDGEDYSEDKEYIYIDSFKTGKWTDEWDCEWTVIIPGIMGQVTGHPLEELDKLGRYRWPRAADKDFSWIGKREGKRCDKYMMLDGGMTLFERMIDLRGFENTMLDIAEREPAFYEMRDQIVNYNMGIIDRLLEYNPDGIYLSDDWGSQISLMISPESWRELFLPCYKKMFSRVRQAGKHVFFHTDGYTIEILPDLVDAGANAFWVDLTVNPLNLLKEKLGGKVCFQGLTDVQFTMRWGTPADVEKHGKDLIKSLGDFNGGFIACSEADPDQPWENIKTIYETFYKYGTYPINI